MSGFSHKLLKPSEVSALLNVTPSHLRRLKIPDMTRTPGGQRRYFDTPEFHAFAEQRAEKRAKSRSRSRQVARERRDQWREFLRIVDQSPEHHAWIVRAIEHVYPNLAFAIQQGRLTNRGLKFTAGDTAQEGKLAAELEGFRESVRWWIGDLMVMLEGRGLPTNPDFQVELQMAKAFPGRRA